MSISFHCKYCGRKIEAADGAGGKWGKCPSCHNKIYIPDLTAGPTDELELAPVDRGEQEKEKQLMKETYSLEQEILMQRESQEQTPASPKQPAVSSRQLKQNIVNYIRALADGDIDYAQTLTASIVSGSERSLEILEQIALSEIPEGKLADIRPHLLSGFIRTLRDKIRKNN